MPDVPGMKSSVQWVAASLRKAAVCTDSQTPAGEPNIPARRVAPVLACPAAVGGKGVADRADDAEQRSRALACQDVQTYPYSALASPAMSFHPHLGICVMPKAR